jgi:hypothetical protein
MEGLVFRVTILSWLKDQTLMPMTYLNVNRFHHGNHQIVYKRGTEFFTNNVLQVGKIRVRA